MPQDKPTIFISHAAVDEEIANLFKSDVESTFLGLCDLFVSSNLDSIQGGSEWIQTIKANLEKAVIFVGLLSPVALSRPWIYTEFGAGWIRGIPTVSVCHSGLTREQLPIPLSHFQGLNLLDELHLEHLYGQVSDAIGCQKPSRNYKADIENYRSITETQRKQRAVRQWVAQLQQWNPEFNKLFQREEVEILIPAEADQAFRGFVQEHFLNEHIEFEPRGMSMGTRVGMQASVWLARPGPRVEEIKTILES